jgi:hypothetical protein
MVAYGIWAVWFFIVVIWGNERRPTRRLRSLLEVDGQAFVGGLRKFIEACYWKNPQYQTLGTPSDREVFELYHYWWYLSKKKANLNGLFLLSITATATMALLALGYLDYSSGFVPVFLIGLSINAVTTLLVILAMRKNRRVFAAVDARALAGFTGAGDNSNAPPDTVPLSRRDELIMASGQLQSEIVERPVPFLAESSRATIMIIALLASLAIMLVLPLVVGLPLGERAFPVVLGIAVGQVPFSWVALSIIWGRKSVKWQASHPMM